LFVFERCCAEGRSEADIFQIADLELDIPKKSHTAGVRIDLTAKEFALLHLYPSGSDSLSRPLIASQVWDMNFDSDTNVVDVAVRRLRAKIDDPFEVKLIHTIRVWAMY
jgi:two-component system copper resistance phosphate regulon response regulator CusR